MRRVVNACKCLHSVGSVPASSYGKSQCLRLLTGSHGTRALRLLEAGGGCLPPNSDDFSLTSGSHSGNIESAPDRSSLFSTCEL